MKLLFIPILITVLLGVGGCKTNKILQATGGSRSDGVVELSYVTGGFEQPVVDWNQGLATASERCRAWGYSSAEPFGGGKSTCLQYNQYGCIRQQVILFTVEFSRFHIG